MEDSPGICVFSGHLFIDTHIVQHRGGRFWVVGLQHIEYVEAILEFRLSSATTRFARPPRWMKMGPVLDRFGRMESDPLRIRGRCSVGAFIARLSTWSGRNFWNQTLSSPPSGGEHV